MIISDIRVQSQIILDPLTTNNPLIQKPVNWFALQIDWFLYERVIGR